MPQPPPTPTLFPYTPLFRSIAGRPVDPAVLRVPAFVAAPARDRIVPPESARPLARLIPGAMLHEPAAGHIGMAAGRSADRKSTRLNSSHRCISYAVFCLKKK